MTLQVYRLLCFSYNNYGTIKLNKINYQTVTHFFLRLQKNVMVFSAVEILVAANSPDVVGRVGGRIILGHFLTALPNFLLAVAPTNHKRLNAIFYTQYRIKFLRPNAFDEFEFFLIK